MTRHPEPERDMVRRAAPLGPPAVVIAFLVGRLVGDWGTAWSAAIGATVVFANFAANGLVLARAARISVVALMAAAAGGFVVRMAAITALVAILKQFAWFSPVACLAALAPCLVVLLAFEARLLVRGLGSELDLSASPRTVPVQGARP